MTNYSIRINKYLADKKISTRRGADELVKEKKVFINGKLAVLGSKVSEKDIVEVRGVKQKEYLYFTYNKPIGIETNSPREGLFPLGRLDKNSHGLLILTNDGRVTDQFLNPKYFHEKEYVVQVDRPVTEGFLASLQRGVNILETRTLPCKAWATGPRSFRIVLTQGLNRQIRRMCEHFGYEVVALQRTRFVNIELGKLQVGYWRNLTAAEQAALLD